MKLLLETKQNKTTIGTTVVGQIVQMNEFFRFNMN